MGVSEPLRAGPGVAAQRAQAPMAGGPPPSRWTLRTIRATLPELAGYSLSGVWRVLRRLGLGVRTARVQQFSPDPAYDGKVQRLAGDWPALRDRVNAFLAQFGNGSPLLLHYVGLQGTGRLARALHPP